VEREERDRWRKKRRDRWREKRGIGGERREG